MGIYGNSALLPSKERFISTYAGAPIEELRELGQQSTKDYREGIQGHANLQAMMNNVDVDDADKEYLQSKIEEISENFTSYAKKGDYENAGAQIIMSATDFSRDKVIKEAQASKVARDKHLLDAKTRFQKGDITRDQYAHVAKRLGEYKGIIEGDDMSAHFYTPAKLANFREKFTAAGKTVEEQEKYSEFLHPRTGAWVTRTTRARDPKEIQAAMMSALENDPELQASFQDMAERDPNGAEGALASIMQDMKASGDAVDFGNKHRDQNQSMPEGGWPTGGSTTGAGTSSYNYVPVQGKEGKDFITVGQDLELGQSMSMEDRYALGRENAYKSSTGGTMDKMGAAISNWWNDVPSDEDMIEYNKISQATRATHGIAEDDWDVMGKEEKEGYLNNYIDTEGKKRSHLGIQNFDPATEQEMNHVKANATQDQMRTARTKLIQDDYGSRAFYSIKDSEKTTPEDNDNLRKGLAGQDGYTVRVLGKADPRNPFTKEDPEFVNSNVMVLEDSDGGREYFMASENQGFQNSQKRGPGVNFSATNKAFDTTKSEIFNTFPTAGYPGSYMSNGISFSGSRAADGSETINVSELSVDGNPLSTGQLYQIASGLADKGVVYDASTGELTGMSEDLLTRIIYSRNKTK
jgi:hypothetical protein